MKNPKNIKILGYLARKRKRMNFLRLRQLTKTEAFIAQLWENSPYDPYFF